MRFRTSVESGAGAPALGSGGSSVAFAPGLSPAPMAAFPVPRSSNRTCEFPAYGFRTRSCLRARKTHCLPRQVHEAVIFPQPLVREAHKAPGPHLVLSTEPLAQPPEHRHLKRGATKQCGTPWQQPRSQPWERSAGQRMQWRNTREGTVIRTHDGGRTVGDSSGKEVPCHLVGARARRGASPSGGLPTCRCRTVRDRAAGPGHRPRGLTCRTRWHVRG